MSHPRVLPGGFSGLSRVQGPGLELLRYSDHHHHPSAELYLAKLKPYPSLTWWRWVHNRVNASQALVFVVDQGIIQ